MFRITSWRRQEMKRREASRQQAATRAIDKSKEAVVMRINKLLDEANRQLDVSNAKLVLQESKRANKLVFLDPLTVGLNLPEHLIGDSADYKTPMRAHGTSKYGLTRTEVRPHTQFIDLHLVVFTLRS